MMSPVTLAVVGAGLIGRRHVAAIAASGSARLDAIVDPSPAAEIFAASAGATWFRDLAQMIAAQRPDGVILATPNAMHVEQGLECVAAGLPTLVEKPIATDVFDGLRLVDAAERAGAPLLVGHHRRHNPLIAAAKSKIEAGALGRIVAVNAMFWLMKPEDYFDADWRRQPGAGPVLINLIHDIDLLRHLCGEIETVKAMESSAVRGLKVEDSAALLLRFANGALGTVSISDTVVAPWSWELTAAENPAYPVTGQACYLIGGTRGALELPNLRLWRNVDKRSWWEPMESETIAVEPEDPLIRQIRHFADVIRGDAAPLVSGREGLRTLAAVEAVKLAARRGGAVATADILNPEKTHHA